MDDLISRQDVINAILASNLSACTVYGRSEEGMETAKELIQAIKNLPSAQPDRKSGKWHSRIYSKIEMFVCSECQHEYSYDAETGEQFYNYCPNCGAKMEVEHAEV